MLGALGDVNQLTNPALHSQVFEYLVELCDTLAKVRTILEDDTIPIIHNKILRMSK
jgi:hypothetical protein